MIVFGVLLLAFLVVPIIEFVLIVEVATRIGTLETIALLVLISVAGAWLVRKEGVGLLRKVQAQLRVGQLPQKELIDGALILFAGALMLTPGFFTDAVGLLLLIPPTRFIVRSALTRRYKGRMTFVTTTATSGGYGPDDVMDVDSVDVERLDDDPPTPLPPS